MSWELGSMLVLLAALGAGFAWYERSHPSSRVLALVGTLAALAALGRIAFAPIPNVKPTTDIVLLSGYALGGAPGFAVGAIAALTSNVFFGQGPWTPWQMAAWGTVGIMGAGLARIGGRQVGRIGLAAAAALAGVVYGVILDVFTWVTFTGDQSAAKLVSVFATSFWFDLAHVIGNVAFCLAFGPALVRMLGRFRARFEVRWLALPAASVLLVLALALPALAAGARSVAYVESAQNADGGVGGTPGAASTQLHSGWAALGLEAAGVNPQDVVRDGHSLMDYIASKAAELTDTGELERTILAVAGARMDPHDFAGRDLVAELRRRRDADGSFDGHVSQTAFAILALRAAGTPRGDAELGAATRWLGRQQNRDGGFNFFRRGGASGIDDTGAAVQGLVAGSRRSSSRVRKAVGFLTREQRRDGGWPLVPGGASNAQSTAWAIQALVAAGRDPRKRAKGTTRSPIAYLTSLTAGDGSVRYSRSSKQTPVWVTAQALAAVNRSAFPVKPPARRSPGGLAAVIAAVVAAVIAPFT